MSLVFMIIIATHNGVSTLTKSGFGVLPILLNSLIGCQREVHVIDTGSKCPLTQKYLLFLKSNQPFDYKLQVHETPNANYDTGAYVYALKHIKAERYYFIHDSLEVLNKEAFNLIDTLLIHNEVIALRLFTDPCVSPVLQKWFGTNIGTKTCIIGPIFFTLRSTIEKIDLDTIPLPARKLEQMAMERGWGIILDLHNIVLTELKQLQHTGRLAKNTPKMFTKHYVGRAQRPH